MQNVKSMPLHFSFHIRAEIKTGEEDARTWTGEICGSKEKEDDILLSRKGDGKRNREKRRMMDYHCIAPVV